MKEQGEIVITNSFSEKIKHHKKGERMRKKNIGFQVLFRALEEHDELCWFLIVDKKQIKQTQKKC